MESRVAETILHEPVKFYVRTRGLIRLIGLKQLAIPIYPLYYGTMVKISGKMAKMETSDQEKVNKSPIKTGYEIIGKNADLSARITAYAVLNGPVKIFLFSRLLSIWLKWHLNSKTGEALLLLILEKTDIMSFLSTIISLRGLNVTAPKKEMSQNITGETIAPGASSATA